MIFNIGKFKALFSRIVGYLGFINFSMILYLFASKEPLGINWVIWLVLACILCLGVGIFDSLFVFDDDSDYNFSRTPRFVRMEHNVEEILKILEEAKKGWK